MKTIIKNLPKITFILLAASIAFTACKKENGNDAAPLSARNQIASVPSYSNTLLFGNWGNPTPPPGVYGTRYFNIISGAQDSTGTIAYHLTFTSTNNLLIKAKPGAGYTLRYKNTTTPFANLTVSDYTSAIPVTAAGLGLNNATDSLNTSLGADGWLNYNSTTHVVTYTHNVVLFLNDGSDTYAFQATAAAGEGSASLNRGKYWFNHGKLL